MCSPDGRSCVYVLRRMSSGIALLFCDFWVVVAFALDADERAGLADVDLFFMVTSIVGLECRTMSRNGLARSYFRPADRSPALGEYPQTTVQSTVMPRMTA